MSSLRALRRTITLATAATVAVCVAVQPQTSTAVPERTYAPLRFDWTPQLAQRFPDCAQRVALARSFVVERFDGTIERMSFDETWRRTHDRVAADDVWVRGQCR